MNSNKKEIYFDKDVFKDVAKAHSINPKVVERTFRSFLTSFKKNIEETDGIMYNLPYLGEMMISHGDALREMEKFKKRAQREKNKVEKERLLQVTENYRVRVRKIRIELEKIKRYRSRIKRSHKRIMWVRKIGMSTPENTRKKENLMGQSLDEVIRRQNEYAYKHYKDKNIPVTL